MKETFEQYGLFIFTAILGIIAITMFIKIFAGDTSLLAPFFSDWLAHFGLH